MSRSTRPTVVFLHGLGRTGRSWRKLESQARAAGHATWRVTYPSMRGSMADSADYVYDRMRAELGPGPKIAVTHSAGGIIARLLADRVEWERVLMLAPPNQGSRLARALSERSQRILDTLVGPKGRELANPAWPEPDFDLAIIAGVAPARVDAPQKTLGRRIGAFTRHCLTDGTLHVDDTKHPTMREFETVAAGHTFLMDHPEVTTMTLRFLDSGRLRF